jgi:putative spermidine/putrescine transport system substrate-binding protein
MKRFVMTRRSALAIAASAALMPSLGSAQSNQIVFTSWGGTTQAAQKTHWADPFTASSGIKVVMDGPTDYGKFKAMVESGNVAWDVVDVEGDFAARAAKDGLLEPIDFSVVNKNNLDSRFTSAHSVGSFYYSFVLGYNKDVIKGKPSNWSSLFDLKAFPGKRTLYKWSAPGVLELALLADGVPADKLYPLDLDRAFKKLDTIKSQIVWWTGGAQSQQLLASGEAPIGMFWNGRVHAIQSTGGNVGISWEQNLPAADVLVVPKGSKNKAAAMKFLAYATSAKAQAGMATETAYAPINTEAKALMSSAAVKELPDQYQKSQVKLNMAYWADNRDAIGSRWYAWQAK